MKKVLVVLVLSLFIASAAFADTPTEKAIGYDGGLSYRMIMASDIGIQGILDLNYDSPADTDNNDAALDLGIGVNVFKCMWETDRGNLNAFAGVGIDMDGSTIKDSDSVTDITIQVGLEPEIFLLDNLSVSTKLGVQIMLMGDTRGVDGKAVTDSGSMQLGTFGQGVSIVSGAAFNWYF